MDNFLEAEQFVIGGLLLDNSKITELDLSPLDFCDQAMGQIFGAMRQLERDSKPFDLYTVTAELERTTGKDWTVAVATVARNTPSARNVAAYADHVKRFKRNREARRIAQDLAQNIGHDDSAIDLAIAELMALDTQNVQTTYTLKEAAKLAVDYLHQVHKSDGALTGIPTGLSDLDESIGGYQNSDLFILGARPAMGKTGFLLTSVLAGDVAAGIISAEMSAFQVALRAISTQGRVDSQKVRTAKLDQEEWERVTTGVIQLTGKPIVIDDRSSPTIGEVQRWARKMRQKHGIKILFVDYLQRLKGNNSRASRIDQVGEVAMGLKTIARELNIPVVALAQVNRNVEQRNDKRPLMGDLANSSEIEKEADEIVMLYRDEVYNPDTEDKGIAEFIIEKNRHGPTGMIRAVWNAPFIKFENLAQQWQNQRAH